MRRHLSTAVDVRDAAQRDFWLSGAGSRSHLVWIYDTHPGSADVTQQSEFSPMPTRRIKLATLFLVCLIVSPACEKAPAPPKLAKVEQEPPTLEVKRPIYRADATAGLPAPKSRPSAFRKGVALGLFVSDTDPARRERYYVQMLDEIKAVGATDVSLVVRWQQETIRTSDIKAAPGVTVDDQLVADVTRLAHARGLRVFLLPTLHIKKRGRKEWRGKIRPPDWKIWWSSYQRFILHYAKLSQEHGIELLAVGSELVSTEVQGEQWRALIKKVREVYRGELTYSANWDHFEPVQFWDALDVVGLTAYHELSDESSPTEEQLVEGWSGFFQKLSFWARPRGYKYMFTEIGYPTHDKAAHHPWDYTAKGDPNLDLQWLLFRAMYRVWHGDERLSGIFVWNWFGPGGADDSGYSPRGKPSEQVLRYWYSEGKLK